MPRGAKIFLYVLTGFAVLIGLLVVGGAIYVVTHKEELTAYAKAEMDKIQVDAVVFAASTDARGCLGEGVRRNAECGSADLICELKATTFTTFCLERAEPVEGLCRGVPDSSAVLETVAWAIPRCQEEYPQLAVERCQRWLRSLQDYCHPDE